jgi:hypothetical protein
MFAGLIITGAVTHAMHSAPIKKEGSGGPLRALRLSQLADLKAAGNVLRGRGQDEKAACIDGVYSDLLNLVAGKPEVGAVVKDGEIGKESVDEK